MSIWQKRLSAFLNMSHINNGYSHKALIPMIKEFNYLKNDKIK